MAGQARRAVKERSGIAEDDRSSSGVTSIRFQPELRKRLEKEAKRNNRNFSREVQARLRDSFKEEETLAHHFGSERNARIMQIAGSVMQMQKNPANPDADWLDDPITFLLARNALLGVLEEIRPRPLPAKLPDEVLMPILASIFRDASARWKEIAKTDPTLTPFAATSQQQHFDSIVRSKYPEVVGRVGTDEYGRKPDDPALEAQERIIESKTKSSTVSARKRRTDT